VRTVKGERLSQVPGSEGQWSWSRVEEERARKGWQIMAKC
jgi:hypothetical protein